jgi:cytochrome c oxidase subunit III
VSEGAAVETPALPPNHRPAPSLLTVGTVVWLASELMFFGALFAAYFTLRAEASVWPPPDVTLETTIAAVATVVLIASSGTIHLAGLALARDDRTMARVWLLVTLAMGALFLANVVREFLVLDFSISSNSYGSMYYLMTGFHGLHVTAGLVLILIGVALASAPGALGRRESQIESITYYWHFVDVVWIGLFLTLFVIR